MNNRVGMFDFLRGCEVDLGVVRAYLKTKGYEVDEIKQPGRHVVGKISRNNNTYFFKMASRPGLSVYIENEYEWGKLLQNEKYTVGWPLLVPQVYTLHRMQELSYLTMEYVDGVDCEEDPRFLEFTVKPVAAVITDILKLRPTRSLVLDEQQPYRNIQERATKRLDGYIGIIGRDRINQRLISFLKNSIEILQSAPARGDIGLGNIRQDKEGKIWLLDSEFASLKNIKFYDVGYYYFRLGVMVIK